MLDCDLNFASATLLVEYDPAADPLPAVVRAVESTGHGIVALDESGEPTAPERQRPWLERHIAEVATVGSGIATGVGALAEFLRASGPLAALPFVAFGIAVVFGGLLVWRRALTSLKARMLDMNVLMSVAVFGAVALGQWGEAATVFFLFSLGGLLESRSLERTRRSIRDLVDLTPAQVRVRRDGAWTTLLAEEVRVGETLLVRPGERVPLDGVVSVGVTAMDEAPITGESVPVDKEPGSKVFAGALNTSGVVEIIAEAPARDSTLARIVHMVEEAQASRAPSQRFVDAFSRAYTPVVMVLAVLVAVVPPLVALLLGMQGVLWSEWIRRGLVVLVVSCPCALVISTPVSIVSAITRASRDGVLVKGGVFLEAAHKIRAVAFDKTGTITTGRPLLMETVALDGSGTAHLLAIAAALEAHSNHPLARAITSAARAGGIDVADAESVIERAGRGISGVVDGVAYELCSAACAGEAASLSAEARASLGRLQSAGASVLVLLQGEEALGLFAVADQVRGEARAVLQRLSAEGVEHTVMLTGDNEQVAESVASQVGLSSFFARMLPDAKTRMVSTLKEHYGWVAMVGDGVNDAPALAAADIGIAMGAAGSDTALETADVALMRDDLSALPGFFALGRRTARTIRYNVVFSIAVKVVFLALALAGRATLWMAVFADTGVSLLVILNGMRLLRKR